LWWQFTNFEDNDDEMGSSRLLNNYEKKASKSYIKGQKRIESERTFWMIYNCHYCFVPQSFSVK